MKDFVDEIERELRPSRPIRSRAALNNFRERLKGKRIKGGHKRFEGELEELLQSERFLQRATERYLAKKVPEAIEAALAALERAEAVLTTYKQKTRESKKPRGFVM